MTLPSDLPTDRKPLSLLTPPQLERLVGGLSVRHVERGEVIYREGDAAGVIMVVTKGKIKTHKGGINGRGQIVKLTTVGDIIGYRAALAGERHQATATAIEATELLDIPVPSVLTAIRENNELAVFVIQTLARELGMMRLRSVTLAQKQTRGRLAEALLLLRDKYGYVPGSQQLNVRMTRSELAQLSNMTTANAIRTLGAFAEEGIIEVEGRAITVCNEQGLEKTSRLG